MMRLKERLRMAVLVPLTLFQMTFARLINNTIFDTNLAHVTYEPKGDFCVRWTSDWWNNKHCEVWAQPWASEVYHNHGQFVGLHRGLNHRLVSMTIAFEGSAIWLYGPPPARLSTTLPDYKVCVQERHSLESDETCYRVDTAAAYSEAERYDEPVVIFVKGGLRHQAHRVVVSVGDPIDNTRAHLGVQFSHAVYTTERPTPWPAEEDQWRFRRVVMHDTHPLLTYYPAPQILDCPELGCSSGMGWVPRTYRAEDGMVISWHELKSRGEQNRDQWGVEATITAGSVAVYGIPKAHITDTDYLSQICVRIDSGQCEMVDIQHAYLNAEHEHESVLLWRHDALDSSQKTHIAVRLVKTTTNEMSVFPFKAIEYYEPQEYASPGWSVGHSENVEVAHDNEQIMYHPGRRCVRHFGRSCTKWWDPWVWREEGPWESRLTYRSTVWSYRTTEDPSIELDFRGSAVYVYGAPKTFIKDPFASQHICLNGICYAVDVEQAYLNAPTSVEMQSPVQHISSPQDSNNIEHQHSKVEKNATVSGVHPEYEPVLIWSMTGLDDQVSHRLRLALAALPSQDNAEMSIAKVVYKKVMYGPGESRLDPPVPQPDPRYEGPVYPPHSRKWVPRDLPPLSSLPPRPYPSSPPSPPHKGIPHYPHTPSQPPSRTPSTETGSGFPLVSVVITFVLSFFLFILVSNCSACARFFGVSVRHERRRLKQSNYTYYG